MPRIQQLLLLLCFTTIGNVLFAQQKIWIYFKDKGPEQVQWAAAPASFLSQRALDRRMEAGKAVDMHDIPVSATYIRQLQNAGLQIHAASKWINAVSVKTEKSLAELQAICPAVTAIGTVAQFSSSEYQLARYNDSPESRLATTSADSFSYGDTRFQIQQLNLKCLHDRGFTGRDVLIAVFDAGFYGADTIPAFDSLWQQGRLVTYYDFVNHDTTVFDEHNHGMNVISTIVGNLPGQFVGAAPHAKLALARTENAFSETNQEEDNWMTAVEWADSLGADQIQSSLGYTVFDSGQVNYTYPDLDGNTTIVTRAADMAAARGILVVNSAGNEGNSPWHHISAPCDADSILCVGAVDFLNGYVNFSGVGPSFDGRVKPDVCALGLFTTIIGNDGSVTHGSGTSFSSPLMSGFSACLRSAHPLRSNMEVIQAIKQSANQFANPDTLLGYGIPDACKADSILSVMDSLALQIDHPNVTEGLVAVYPNPTGDFVVLENRSPANPIVNVSVTSVDGKSLINVRPDGPRSANKQQLSLKNLPAGVYLIRIELKDTQTQTTRIIRN